MFDLKFISNVKKQDDKMKEIVSAVKKLEKLQTFVGIPADESARQSGDGINNAELLYIHTHGSAINGIPPRSVIEPSVEDDRETIGNILKEAAQAATSGNSSGAESALNKAGMRGQNVARDWFTNPKNSWAKNKPATVRKKGSAQPLIDTGELRKSITYVVKEK